MKKYAFFLSCIPFITACHSLSLQKSEKKRETAHSFLSRNGDFLKKQGALKQFQEVIDHSYLQSQADWHYIKGERKSIQGFYHQAIGLFKSALIYLPDSFSLRLRLTDEYLNAGLYLQAFKQCNILLEKRPDSINVHLRIGKIYLENQMYKKALGEYKWVLNKNPRHIEALYAQAWMYMKQEKFSAARPNLVILSRIGEDNLDTVHYFLGLVRKKEGRLGKALFHFEKALHFQPRFMLPYLELSALYQEKGQTNEAIHVLEKLQKNTGFYSPLSLFLFYFYAQQKNRSKVTRYLQFISEKQMDNWLAHIQWALTGGQKDEVIAAIEKFLSAKPRLSTRLYILYAFFLEKKQDFSKALNVLLKASEIFPTDTDILFYKGFLYDQLGQTNEAIKQMKAVLELNTSHVDALNHLAFTYAELNKNLELAERMAIKALSFSPNDSYVLDTAGWVFFKRGKSKEALQYLERAYRNNTSEGVIAGHLAEVYYHLNMIDKSIVLYKKAIGLETDEHKRKKLEKKLLSIQWDV